MICRPGPILFSISDVSGSSAFKRGAAVGFLCVFAADGRPLVFRQLDYIDAKSRSDGRIPERSSAVSGGQDAGQESLPLQHIIAPMRSLFRLLYLLLAYIIIPSPPPLEQVEIITDNAQARRHRADDAHDGEVAESRAPPNMPICLMTTAIISDGVRSPTNFDYWRLRCRRANYEYMHA